MSGLVRSLIGISGGSSSGSSMPGQIYLFTNHLNTSSGGKLTYSITVDGTTPTRIGKLPGYFPPDSPTGFVRDPTTMEWSPTQEFITAYTAGNTGLGNVIGLCKARDFNSPEFVTSIEITGITGTVTRVWVGTLHHIDGRVILTLLPFIAGDSFDSPGVGWIECLDPGTWTEWTDFVSFKDTNPNLQGVWHFNDPQIVKVGSAYHMFMDGHFTDGGTGGGITHCSSSSFLTGYSVPTELAPNITSALGEFYEGAIVARNPENNGWLLYYQTLFGPLYYSKGSDDFLTWTDPTLVPWPENFSIGNGSVIRVTEPWAIKAMLAAGRPAFAPGDDNDGQNNILNFDSLYGSINLAYKAAIGLYTDGSGPPGVNIPGRVNIGSVDQPRALALIGGSQLVIAVSGEGVFYSNFNDPTLSFFGWSNESTDIVTVGKTDGRIAINRGRNIATEMLDVNGNCVVSGCYLLPGGVKIASGTGSPEGSVTAPIGSTYHRTDAGAFPKLYSKDSGAGNTGWTAVL